MFKSWNELAPKMMDLPKSAPSPVRLWLHHSANDLNTTSLPWSINHTGCCVNKCIYRQIKLTSVNVLWIRNCARHSLHVHTPDGSTFLSDVMAAMLKEYDIISKIWLLIINGYVFEDNSAKFIQICFETMKPSTFFKECQRNKNNNCNQQDE